MEVNFRLSVSKAKTFNTCKKQYKFAYIEKLPSKEFEHFTFGSVCHLVLELFHNEYINGCTDPFNKVLSRSYKEAIRQYELKVTENMKKEIISIFNEYLLQISRRETQANILACEKPFQLILEDPNLSVAIMLNGVIDRIQLDKDGVLHVADYKTTKNKQFLVDDWFQLLVYAYVLYKENPDLKKVRVSYILLRHNFEYLSKEFEIEEIMKVEPKIIEYASNILKEKDFNATTNNLCQFCSYLDLCEEGRSVLYKNKNGEIKW